MKNTRLIFTCTILTVLVLVQWMVTTAQQPFFRHYTVNDGLLSSEVYYVLQDAKGYMWFATDRGVNRFDGYTFRNYTTENGLNSNTVFSIHEDHKGRLWFRTFSGGLSYWLKDSIYTPGFNQQLIRELGQVTINSMYVDREDTIWLGLVQSGMIKITPDHQVFRITDTLDKFNLYLKEIDEAGMITGNDGNIMSKNGRLLYVKFHSHHNDQPVTADFDDQRPGRSNVFSRRYSDGKYLIGHNNNLFSVSKEGIRLLKTLDRSITHITADSEGNIWIGLLHGGALCYAKGVFSDPPQSYLPDKSVAIVMEDREGSFWFATLNDGVYYLPSRSFISYTVDDGLAGNKVSCLAVSDSTRLWIGLDNGYINCLTQNGIATYDVNPKAGLRHSIMNLFVHPDGNIWVSASGGGFLLDKQQAYSRTLEINQSLAYFRENDSVVWTGNRMGLVQYTHLRKQVYPPGDGRLIRVNAIEEGLDGALLIGSLDGLWRFRHKKYEYLGHNHELLGKRITAIRKIGRHYCLATRGAGLLITGDLENVNQITESDGLVSNLCNALTLDEDSILWVSTYAGLSKITFLSGDPLNYHIDNYTLADGLLSNEINNVCIMGDKVWAATNQGLVGFHKKEASENVSPPPVYMVSGEVNGAAALSTFEFSYRENNIELAYVGLSYKDAGRLLYKYRLEGIDPDWIYTKHTTVRYPDLAPGDYRFKVSAINEDRFESSHPAEWRFTIKPPFWQTWWFRLMSVVAIGLGIYAFFKVRILTYNRDVVRSLLLLVYQKFSKKAYLVFKSEGNLTKVDPRQILWLKAADNYVEIITKNRTYLVRSTLKAMMQQLPAMEFQRVHRSYIIRIDKVASVRKNSLLINDQQIPVSESHLPDLKKLKEDLLLQ